MKDSGGAPTFRFQLIGYSRIEEVRAPLYYFGRTITGLYSLLECNWNAIGRGWNQANGCLKPIKRPFILEQKNQKSQFPKFKKKGMNASY